VCRLFDLIKINRIFLIKHRLSLIIKLIRILNKINLRMEANDIRESILEPFNDNRLFCFNANNYD